MKEFDINLAKQGKPVCTRDGRKVRIVCYDLKAEHRRSYPLVALVEDNEEGEYIETYSEQGVAYGDVQGADNDLMMLPEKHEGWVNVYDTGKGHSVYQSKVYDTEEEAKKGLPVCTSFNMITVKLEWKE